MATPDPAIFPFSSRALRGRRWTKPDLTKTNHGSETPHDLFVGHFKRRAGVTICLSLDSFLHLVDEETALSLEKTDCPRDPQGLYSTTLPTWATSCTFLLGC